MSVLTQANRDWESRPADERFSSIVDMHGRAVLYRQNAAEATVAQGDLQVVADDGNLSIVGPSGDAAALNNWSFDQLAKRAKAPAGYLQTVGADLAAQCLNVGLQRTAKEAEESEDGASRALILFDNSAAEHKGLKVRGITSTLYSRIWNADVTARLLQLEERGPWQPAPAAFDGSRGLYLGDRDMFAFMVDNDRRIFQKGPGGGLSRGFMIWNGEVGDRSIGVMTFFYEYVCGNHRIWGVKGVEELRIAHIYTDGAKAWDKLAVTLKTYAESSAEDDEAKVAAAHSYELGATKEEVLDAVFKLQIGGLSKKVIGEAYDLVDTTGADRYGSPRTAWGLAGGITEIARDLPNADERTTLDRAATKIMQIAF